MQKKLILRTRKSWQREPSATAGKNAGHHLESLASLLFSSSLVASCSSLYWWSVTKCSLLNLKPPVGCRARINTSTGGTTKGFAESHSPRNLENQQFLDWGFPKSHFCCWDRTPWWKAIWGLGEVYFILQFQIAVHHYKEVKVSNTWSHHTRSQDQREMKERKECTMFTCLHACVQFDFCTHTVQYSLPTE